MSTRPVRLATVLTALLAATVQIAAAAAAALAYDGGPVGSRGGGPVTGGGEAGLRGHAAAPHRDELQVRGPRQIAQPAQRAGATHGIHTLVVLQPCRRPHAHLSVALPQATRGG